MFSIFKRKDILPKEEQATIVAAVQKAEQRTSGEVRVFIESRCKFINALDRAVEIFQQLKMDQTKERNAVIVYVATKDRQVAVFGDEGIHQKVGEAFWQAEVTKMISLFSNENISAGISQCVIEIGEVLHQHFPYNKDIDKNELPDDIVFGR